MQQCESVRAGDILDDKYLVEALIGRGGMGSVFRARHIRLNSPRAIKLMRAELTDDEDFVRRFQNEALLAEGVRHPNVVALYDFATLADGTRYIVWEYVEGETIGDLLDRGVAFSSEEVRNLVRQVADGLSAAHQKGVLHRDVSPDNVMLFVGESDARAAKLLDFGLAKAVGYPASVPSNPSVIFGKIGFASPEQMGLLGNDERIDERTDIFSLAAVAYAMLTGEPPFCCSSLKSFLHELMIAPEEELRARFREKLPAAWERPLIRALSRDRVERPPTIGAFLTDIDEAAGVAAREAKRSADRAQKNRLWRTSLYVSMATALVLSGMGTLLLMGSLDLDQMPPVPASADSAAGAGRSGTRVVRSAAGRGFSARPSASIGGGRGRRRRSECGLETELCPRSRRDAREHPGTAGARVGRRGPRHRRGRDCPIDVQGWASDPGLCRAA